jgi:hypothetical protein
MVCGACDQAGHEPRGGKEKEKKKKKKRNGEKGRKRDKFTNTVVDSPKLVEATDKVVVTVEGAIVVLVVGVNPEPSSEVLVSGLEARVLVVLIGVVVRRGVRVTLGVVEVVVGVVERSGEVLATETRVGVEVDEGKVVVEAV